MKLIIEGEQITPIKIYMLSGRFDWTDEREVRHTGTLPEEFTVRGEEPDGLYVRVDRATSEAVGFANEVSLERDITGATLFVDDCPVHPDAGFSLFIAPREKGKRGQSLRRFSEN